MKYVDEFREPEKASKLFAQIETLAAEVSGKLGRPVQLMEFCGGHTHAIFRFGIEQMLSKNIELIHGPGCPVCVLPRSRVDDCVALAERDDVIFTTFGDAMRVPGSKKSLLQAKADGAQVKMVYSPLDALALAKQNPDKEVIFFALGFETTMPSTALTLLQAESDGVKNFSLFCNHITTVPILQSLLDAPQFSIDGFVAPGHVSMVVGEEPFDYIANRYQKPLVITGFEPLDILQSIIMLLLQLKEGRAQMQNQYARVVLKQGNHPGLSAMAKVFELRDKFEWRGLGSIDQSGVKIRDEYARYDAERKFPVASIKVEDPINCQCGEVLKGMIKPWQCKVFGTLCTPEQPLGALMVSSEGACAAYYRFGNVEELLVQKENYLAKGK
ncbi:MAG: hydrogenase formation protein HypD [Candidatus Obscuribacter sp.]|nr:hydrogenase formation protein HypD [Candidatus Obscuribacter sp.]MBK7836116.1 hydrogenase formation protein HypD [Candidatus Obscuribacter sp.]MBK9618016.1 hydrogenase formation protein HypD [Candidatus Obscuribacter sp.]MBK9770245.1 hydrogenase formation protein HypD [Candidatus Obscuribacter sp.]MDQ5965528.1 hydrogenase expression/formation protein HypD [Cyanobacteriota bacterium erpe_2018_sw_39hr_WHONDRS-SW48-000098_B_bin.30]